MKRFAFALLAVAIATFGSLFVVNSTQAANDIYIAMPPIEGEAIDKGHERWIKVFSVNFQVSQSAGTHIASGGTAGKAEFGDLEFVKQIDKASVHLNMHCASGRLIDQVIVECVNATTKVVYLRIKLEKVMVSAVRTGLQSAEGQATEQVSLNYGKITWEYVITKQDGSKAGSVKYGWSLEENRAL